MGLPQWQADFSRAALLKRRWRNQVRRLCICKGGAALLAKELPPELWGGRLGLPRFGGAAPNGGPQAGSEGCRELAIRALLECRPGQLNAWLDAEHWADAIGVKPAAVVQRWSRRSWPAGAGKALRAGGKQLAQERDHVAMLNRYIKQMEKELDHFVANHERAATLAERLPLLLQRARQQLGTCSAPHP